MTAVPRLPSTAALRTEPSTSLTALWRCASSTLAPSRRERSTDSGARLSRSMYCPAMSRRRTGAPVDQTTSTVRASGSAVAGARVARRVSRKALSFPTSERVDAGVVSVSAIGGLLLLRRRRLVEGEPKPLRALAVGCDLGIHLFGVVAALRDRL